MKNKLTIGTSIAFLVLIVISLVFVLTFSEKVRALQGSSDDYDVRFALGNIASNASNNNYEARFFSGNIAANLTPSSITGRLSILRNNLPPLQPSLNTPNNDTGTNETTVEFIWTNTTDPNRLMEFDQITYLLEIYNNTALTELYFRNSTIDETTLTAINVSIPEENLNLYWRVLATDGELNSSFSETRTLIKDNIPPTSFNLVSPTNGTSTTDNTPSLAWTPTTEVNLQNYTIELSTSSTFTTPNFTEKSTTTDFSNWTTQLDANTYFWSVTAFDKAGFSNTSDQFELTIEAITETITTTVSTGETVSRSGGVKKKPFNLDIISPPSITVYSEDSVIVPLIITNPANEVILKGITLNVTSESEDVAPLLATTFIPLLRPKEQREVPLTIVTHSEPGTYGITITANILNPRFSDSVKIFANLIARDDTSESRSNKQVIFAKEFFNGNPGCIELNEYITQAEEEFANGRFDKALNLADNAIQSCKDLIAFKAQPEPKNFQTYLKKAKLNDTALILIGETIAFLFTILIAVKIIRRKKK